MKPPFLPGRNQVSQAIRTLGVQASINKQNFPRASFVEDPVLFDEDDKVLASIAPRIPPGTAVNMVDAGLTIAWSSGSLDITVSLTYGTASIATIPCLVTATAGSYVGRISALHRPGQQSWETPYQLRVSQTGSDTLTLYNIVMSATPATRMRREA
jgi:hypothetical protein